MGKTVLIIYRPKDNPSRKNFQGYRPSGIFKLGVRYLQARMGAVVFSADPGFYGAAVVGYKW
jgi:hypothetical protein